MCGISGKVSLGKSAVATDAIAQMNRAIAHRGPDDTGIYISPDRKVGLGHQRLSIIDTSPLGHQPMRYMNRYEIVFNGEIYNFQEKRSLLKKEGYAFTSNSDTEVLLALYDKYGKECLEHLRGMFAFAIYDEQEKTLFCARDRVGKKPFKYYMDDNLFIFASELKAILTQREYHREPDYTAIHHYLTLQYVPAPLTGFKNIKKLEPAHYLFLNIKTGKLEKQRYWKLDYSKKLHFSEKEWGERIIEKLEESVKLRMISDVPIGAFLSGGIDSSAVVGLMSKHSSKPVKTFSIGFREKRFNELPYARKVANQFRTDHTEFIVKPDTIEVLPQLIRQYEEPYADSSQVPTYYLSKLTREHVTVALNGDGGDENFAGYGRYSIQKFALWYDKLLPLHKIIALPMSQVLRHYVKNTFTERASRFSATVIENYAKRYVNYLCYFTNSQKNNLYTSEFSAQMKHQNSYDIVANKFAEAATPNKLDQTLYADITTYLPDDLLVKVDIASMAVGLESRSPFLDHSFMELAAQIPFNLKLKGFNEKKHILKKALKGTLTDEILHRPKMGFGMPIELWFKEELKNYARSIILAPHSFLRTIFKADQMEHLLHTHATTQIDHSPRIWALLSLELWYQEHFR